MPYIPTAKIDVTKNVAGPTRTSQAATLICRASAEARFSQKRRVLAGGVTGTAKWRLSGIKGKSDEATGQRFPAFPFYGRAARSIEQKSRALPPGAKYET
jgi:hypothetical protein